MDALSETITLKITFPDGKSTKMEKWFTDQFVYFRDIIEDIGESRCESDGKMYKYLEIDMSTDCELSKFLTKNTLIYLKRHAYHCAFMYDDDETDHFDDPNEKWSTNDDDSVAKMLEKYIDRENMNELFKVYLAADYLGNSILSHAITDVLINYISTKGCLNISKLEKAFGVKSKFNKEKQEEIFSKFEWEQ